MSTNAPPSEGHEELERYGTITAWSSELRIAVPTLRKLIDPAGGIPGKDASGRVNIFFAESLMRGACADILQAPQADRSGFFLHGGERYGTVTAWARETNVGAETISRGLAGQQGLTGRDWWGKKHDSAFFPESAVRSVTENIERLEHAVDGFGMVANGEETERYGSLPAWAKELGLSEASLRRRLRNVRSTTMKLNEERAMQVRMYPEQDVRSACADLLLEVPHSNEQEFFLYEGERYGSVLAWSKELGVSRPVLHARLKHEQGITGKNKNGAVLEHGFFSEPCINQLCGDLVTELPQADASGFFTKENKGEPQRFGTAHAWSKELHVGYDSMKARLNGEDGIRGRSSTRQLHTFYPESLVRERCKDLLASKESNGE